MAKSLADSGVELDTWARKIGISVEKLSALRFAVERQGFSFDQLREGLKTLQENMDDAVRGNATYAEQFARIGVSVTDTNGRLRNVVDVLPDVAAGFRRVVQSGGVQELALVTADLLGDSESLLAVWLQQGPKAIEDGLRRAVEVGAILDQTFVAAARRFVTAWSEAVSVFRGLVADMFKAVEPFLTAATDMFREWMSNLRLDPSGLVEGIRRAITEAIDWIVRALGQFVANAIRVAAFFLDTWQHVVNSVQRGSTQMAQSLGLLKLAWQKTFGLDTTETGQALTDSLFETERLVDMGGDALRAYADGAEASTQSVSRFLGTLAKSLPWLDAYLQRVRELQATPPAAADDGPNGPGGATQLQRFIGGFGEQLGKVREQWTNFTQQGSAAAVTFGSALQTNLAGSIESFLDGTRSAGQAFKDFGKLMIRSLIQMIAQFASLVILATAFNALTGGGFAGFGGFFGLTAAAKGASFGPGGVRRFADGGVVDRPTPFTYSGGSRLGVMGEAGPEAILPLRRGPGGRLGVEAAGGGGGPTFNVVNNFSGGAGERGNQEDMVRRIESVMLALVEQPRVRKAFRAGRYA